MLTVIHYCTELNRGYAMTVTIPDCCEFPTMNRGTNFVYLEISRLATSIDMMWHFE